MKLRQKPVQAYYSFNSVVNFLDNRISSQKEQYKIKVQIYFYYIIFNYIINILKYIIIYYSLNNKAELTEIRTTFIHNAFGELT
jgi:hypothetical protein